MSENSHVLVIDDEKSLREFLSILLEGEGYTVTTAASVGLGIECLDRGKFNLVMCDLKLPDGSGLDVLRYAREKYIETPFFIITAHTTPQHALEALRAGAAEYLSKPFNVDDLKLILAKLLKKPKVRASEYDTSEFVGVSPPMQRILATLPRIAATPSTVLITGESGTGKELLANAIHNASRHAAGPFLSVNCGAIPEALLESELFGHVRGSFTGAIRDHSGLFVGAEDGTIFLDEIGEMTQAMQVKLLRVLQEKRVRPIGGTRENPVNARVLAATNRDLKTDVEKGRFREDLYYRLNVLHMHLPPLRHRGEDLPDLARHFVKRTCLRFGVGDKKLTADAIRLLQAYTWPGNVRELENIIERTVALEPLEIISSGSLPAHLSGELGEVEQKPVSLPEEGIDLEEYLNGLRLEMMRQALERAGGKQKTASKLLRLSYRAFRYHAEKLGLIRDTDK